jgi:hypothetical protein
VSPHAIPPEILATSTQTGDVVGAALTFPVVAKNEVNIMKMNDSINIVLFISTKK